MADTYLEVRNITKAFLGVLALNKVNFSVKKGEVHVLCGENGAGKSTLMKILNGIYNADSGEILVKGSPVKIQSPSDARDLGIAMIFQECAFVPELTVAESLMLGELPVTKLGKVNWRQVHDNAKQLLQAEGLLANPRLIDGIHTKLKELTISDIQMLEIVKAISKNPQVLIMDEPTSSLAQKEADKLLEKVLELKQRGKSIIYISHKMDELFKIADTISVFRDGCMVKSGPADSFTRDSLIHAMVGRNLSNDYPKVSVPRGKVLLQVKNLNRLGVFKDISFDLKAGEIVGFAGLVGAGRTEVARALNGLDPIDSGEITINGHSVDVSHVSDSIENGLVMCSEDRRRYGLVLVRDIKENISLPNLERYMHMGWLDKKKELQEVQQQCKALQIKAPSANTPVSHLSGGNQQKVVLAKWLLKNPSVLILDEPTRGIDVGAKYEIYKLMSQIVSTGEKGILMISSELPELIGMCDRIYVMAGGQITGELARAEFSQHEIMQYATRSKINYDSNHLK